jgi:hypothetical protein
MTTETQIENAAPAGATDQNNSFSIPETYKDRGWVEKIKSPDDLWKTLDNAQSLLGKRPAGIPANDAPPEEWERFYQAAGRPETPDKYELKDPEGIPEGLDITEAKQRALGLMHKSGLTQRQAENLWKEYMGLELEIIKKEGETTAARQAELDKEFDEITKKHFGDNFEETSKAAIDFAASIVPDDLRGVPGELVDNPKALAYIAALAKGARDKIAAIEKEYGKEGSLTSGNQASTESIEDIRKELAALRTSKESRDPLHPDFKKNGERIAELSARVDRFYKSQ